MYSVKLLPDSKKVIYLSYISYNYIERYLKVIAKKKKKKKALCGIITGLEIYKVKQFHCGSFWI